MVSHEHQSSFKADVCAGEFKRTIILDIWPDSRGSGTQGAFAPRKEHSVSIAKYTVILILSVASSNFRPVTYDHLSSFLPV